jgi:hypothetical protein
MNGLQLLAWIVGLTVVYVMYRRAVRMADR